MDLEILARTKRPPATRQIVLASRPVGNVTLGHLREEEGELFAPTDGQIVVRNLYMSLDPAMRPRMNDAKSYAAPFQVGEPLEGQAVGVIIESNSQERRIGQVVLHWQGWREFATVDAATTTVVESEAAPLSAYLGPLGGGGMTAWAGLVYVARIQPGDVVWVSAASGSVGQMAGQLAKQRGASLVLGSTGSAEKAAALSSLGYDAGFDYHDGELSELVNGYVPGGLDVYFDNVGGEHLEAAIDNARLHARFAICGAISNYNLATPAVAPRNLNQVVTRRLSLLGFLVFDFADKRDQFLAEVAPLIATGQLRYEETISEGLDAAPQAFLNMLSGAKLGKALVRLVE